jgi:ribonuclease P protein component
MYNSPYGGTLRRHSFPKSRRLKSNRQFKHVITNGLRVSDSLFTLYMVDNDCGHSRLGISVGKSYGSAVVRNRLKRMLREIFRQSVDAIPSGFDYVLIASTQSSQKPRASDRVKKVSEKISFEQAGTSFLNLVKNAVGARTRSKEKFNTGPN